MRVSFFVEIDKKRKKGTRERENDKPFGDGKKWTNDNDCGGSLCKFTSFNARLKKVSIKSEADVLHFF